MLTEAQWKKIAPLLPKPPKQRKGGRPWIENRCVLEGILWILRSGARWQDMPENFPHPSTCWRRLRDWEERGVWLKIWRTFLSELNERQQLKWSESFLDGSFAPAKKGAAESEKPSGARGRSGWWWSTAAVFLWETTFTLHPRRKSSSVSYTHLDVYKRQVLLDRGKIVAMGTPTELKRTSMRGQLLLVECEPLGPGLAILPGVPGVLDAAVFGNAVHVVVQDLSLIHI